MFWKDGHLPKCYFLPMFCARLSLTPYFSNLLCPHTTKGKQIVIDVPVSYLQLVYRILADPAKQIWDTFMDKPWLTQSE